MRRFKRIKAKKFFMGELMICASCGRTQQSHPNQESGWTVIELEGAPPRYICPECLFIPPKQH